MKAEANDAMKVEPEARGYISLLESIQYMKDIDEWALLKKIWRYEHIYDTTV